MPNPSDYGYVPSGQSPSNEGLTFREACAAVVEHCPDEYAKSYAQAGLDRDMDGEMARVQCLYILGNMTHWRGDRARAVREALKRLSKEA
jgi:hypothetical protein